MDSYHNNKKKHTPKQKNPLANSKNRLDDLLIRYDKSKSNENRYRDLRDGLNDLFD